MLRLHWQKWETDNWLAAISPAWLVAIYTGGFASPTVTALLRQLRAHQPSMRFCHWGDLNAGGFRLLAHLRGAAGGQQTPGLPHSRGTTGCRPPAR